jgi:hypothetical protein
LSAIGVVGVRAMYMSTVDGPMRELARAARWTVADGAPPLFFCPTCSAKDKTP